MADAKVIPFGEEPRARRKARRAGRTERGTALAPVPEARTEHPPAVPPRENPGRSLDERIAGGLAFLRRRITGDYEVDDFGYDEELTDQVLMSLLRPFYEKYFRVEVKGVENIPSDGGALIVANHLDAAAGRPDAAGRGARQPPGAASSATAGGRFGVRPAGDKRAGAQGRAHPRLRGGRPAAAGARRDRRGDAGGLQGHRQALRGPLQAAAVRARRLRLDGAEGRGADRAVLDRGRRGDLPDDRELQDAGAGAGAAVLPDHADLPVAGTAGSGAAADEVDDPVRRADPDGRLSAGGGGRPDADVQPDRPGTGNDSAHPLQAARTATLGVLLGKDQKNTERRRDRFATSGDPRRRCPGREAAPGSAAGG